MMPFAFNMELLWLGIFPGRLSGVGHDVFFPSGGFWAWGFFFVDF